MITDVRHINTWFSWASYVREVNPKQEMGEGKMFVVGYRVPVWGDYKFLATITHWDRGK